MLEKGTNASDEYKADTNLDYKLPIKKGDKVGTLDIYNGKTLEKSIPLIAENDLNSVFGFITENQTVKYSIRLLLALGTLFIIFVISRILKKRRIRKRRSNKYRRKQKWENTLCSCFRC